MGPLAGVRVIEMKGLGPAPYAGMLLADMGADVIAVERAARHAGIGLPAAADNHMRGKRSLALDIKKPASLAALLRLIDSADALIEGYRPGVAERLGFGPETCLERNARLVYGRVTGWGQDGPLAHTAGHDINYIALSGALAAIGGRDRPVSPLNLLGDYAGGSLFLVVGMLAALMEARQSGRGQVVDAAITDGSASLMSLFHSLDDLGAWQPQREANLLDGAAPQYGVYETQDGKYLAVGALEPKFWEALAERANLDTSWLGQRDDPANWERMRSELSTLFRTRSQQDWCELFAGSDACVTPVLNLREAADHEHHRARGTYVEIGGRRQPAPAPRFSRSQPDTPQAPRAEGSDTVAILKEAGFSAAEIDELTDD